MYGTTLKIVAVGGLGGLPATLVLGEAALQSGKPFRVSENHTVAQRGMVAESTFVFGEQDVAPDGAADILLGLDPLETLHALDRCGARTVVVTSISAPPLPAVKGGTSAVPDLENLRALIRRRAACLVAVDAVALARQAGSEQAVEMVMLGALSATGLLPVTSRRIRESIRARSSPAFVAASLDAFEFGFLQRGCC